MPGGRPTKFNSDLQARLIVAVRASATLELACRACSIDYATFRRWMIKGERGHSTFREFCEVIKRTQAEEEVAGIAEIYAASLGGQVVREEVDERTRPDGTRIVTTKQTFRIPDWRARAWLMERRHRERWGYHGGKSSGFDHKQQEDASSGNRRTRIEMLKRLTAEERTELRRMILKARGSTKKREELPVGPSFQNDREPLSGIRVRPCYNH
jgi:hypothetical protein